MATGIGSIVKNALSVIPKLISTREFSLSELKSFVYGPPTISGVAVNEELALGISAVWRALYLISSTIASVDVEVVRTIPSKGKVAQPRHGVTLLLNDPNDLVNNVKFWRTFVLHCAASGNALAEIERDEEDRPIALHLIHWRNVELKLHPDGSLFYLLKREGKEVPASDVVHVVFGPTWDGVWGISPIRAARETLGISISSDRFAGSVFGNGAIPRGILQSKNKLNPETKANIREAWESLYGGPDQANKVGILGPDLTWIETNMTPADSQLLLSRTFQIEEVSRIYGAPPNLLFSGNQGSYNSNEESNIQFYQLGLRPILSNLEAEFNCKLLTREERAAGFHVRYKVDSLIRGNFEATVNAWSRLFLSGLAKQNEGRERLGLNPVEGGDEFFIPANMQLMPDGSIKVGATEDQPGKPPKALPAPEEKKESEPVEEVPGRPTEELRTILLVSSAELRGAVRDQFLAEINRALRRQAKQPDIEAYIIDALAPSHRAYCLAEGVKQTVEDFAAEWMMRFHADGIRSAEEVLCLVQ